MPYKNARRNFAATCGRTIFLYSHESTSLQCREKMTAFYFTTCLANLPQTIRNEGSKIFKVSVPLLRTLSSLVLKPDFYNVFMSGVVAGQFSGLSCTLYYAWYYSVRFFSHGRFASQMQVCAEPLPPLASVIFSRLFSWLVLYILSNLFPLFCF